MYHFRKVFMALCTIVCVSCTTMDVVVDPFPKCKSNSQHDLTVYALRLQKWIEKLINLLEAEGIEVTIR